MRRHPFDLVSFFFGCLFLAVGIGSVTGVFDDDLQRFEVLGPVVLIGIGMAVLLSAVASRERDEPAPIPVPVPVPVPEPVAAASTAAASADPVVAPDDLDGLDDLDDRFGQGDAAPLDDPAGEEPPLE